MELTVFNDRVYELVDPAEPLVRLATGFVFTEGPVWHDGIRYFTDFKVDRIYAYKDGEAELINDHSDFTVGMTYDRARDRILRCTRERRAISDMDGNIIVGHYGGVPINGSNDVIADSKGRVYFTDPLSRKLEGPQTGHSSVFCYDEEAGAMTLLDSSISYPNGLALTPDERGLYIIDTNSFSVFKLVLATKRLSLFLKLDETQGAGRPDGMRVDERGNLYVTGPGGIWLIDPEATALGLIRTPEVAANLCFDDRGLFITASTSVYRVNAKIPSAV